MPSCTLTTLSVLFIQTLTTTSAFHCQLPLRCGKTVPRQGNMAPLMMAKKSPKKGAPVAKGFGAKPTLAGKASRIVSADSERFFQWLKAGGAAVSKVAIADFDGLRGVAAEKNIEEGEVIVSIPRDICLNLGSDGVNPGYAAAQLVRIEKDEERRRNGWFQPFFDMLPKYEQCDTTEFYSDNELNALEWDAVIQETKSRVAMLRSTYEASQVGLGNDIKFTWEEFLWGVYQIVSRVLTIYTNEDGAVKYLIPMIDMFNHDPASPHQLKATRDGLFQIIAGKKIFAGQQINFPYGGGNLNNDRIIQDYGFVESSNSHDVKQLLLPATSEPVQGIPYVCRGLDAQGLEETLKKFSTTLDDDDKLLQKVGDMM